MGSRGKRKEMGKGKQKNEGIRGKEAEGKKGNGERGKWGKKIIEIDRKKRKGSWEK